MEWFLYDNGLRHEKVKLGQFSLAEALKTIISVENYHQRTGFLSSLKIG